MNLPTTHADAACRISGGVRALAKLPVRWSAEAQAIGARQSAREQTATPAGALASRGFLKSVAHFAVLLEAILLATWVGGNPNLAAEESPNRPVARELKEGDLFPELKDFPLDGKVPATLKGKVAVVDFWASWCAPCQQTFPVMEDLHLRFHKQGLVIVAINVDKSRAAMEEFLKEHPVTFNVVRDSKRELVSRLRLPSLPATYVLDRQGRVRSVCNGFKTAEIKKQHVKLIEELLKEPALPANPTPRP